MDQCKHCQLRGDMVKCFQEDCTIHESWYVLEILEHIKELTEQLKNTPSNSDYEKCSHIIGLICDVLDITISECDELNLHEIYHKIVEIKNVVKELSQHFA